MLKLAVVASFLVLQVLGGPVKISHNVEQILMTKGKADVIISLQSTKPILSELKSTKFASIGERKTVVANSLKAFAKGSQSSILSFLSTQDAIIVKSFWISNEVYVKNADAALITRLAARSDVLRIREELKEKMPLEGVLKISKHFQGEVEWGVEKIGAPAVWELGFNGTGAVAGMMDSGVQYTHEALRDNYVGDYGWFAPISRTELPSDDDGHGTHVMGTIVGQGGIGVAPGAKWMACQNIPGGEAEDIECGQFFACPHLPDESEPDCAKAPDFVSNSWGYGGGGDDFFDGVFEAWEAAGIVPIFAAGNEGPSCTSLRSPGDSAHEALVTVGSTDINDDLSYFSSFGPSILGPIKPDISGPGSDIRSSCIGASDASYCTMSGTSMATPHTAGVVALIRCAQPNLSVKDVAQLLYAGATNTVAQTGANCGGISEGSYPNNHVGHGRLSASGSFNALLKQI